MRVLIVEDDVPMAAALRRWLSAEGIVTDVAGRGEDALWMAGATEFDVVVLDVMLPGIDGFETCRRLREDGVWAPIIMLTARDEVADRVAGLDEGADDYLTKPFSLPELLARLRALARRGSVERPPILEVGDLGMDPATRRVWRGDEQISLSAKEFALLEVFMRRPDGVLSQFELLERRLQGIEGTARVFARPLPDGVRPAVVAVGQSLDDRRVALSGIVTSFAVGGPVAVLLASIVGYALATAGLRPVEAIRRRAERVSHARGDERLPLPAARDEVRRLGETLNDMLTRLQASFERERRFVADAGHELRTPLAVLKTELGAALRRGGHSAEVEQSLVAAAAEADHLAQLADDLLAIARAADDQLPVRPESTRVRELLDQAAQRFADRAREQGRAIRVDAPSELHARLDPVRARQALGNLVDNGLRHGKGDIDLSARERGGSLEIDVSDDGAGFPRDLAPRAFERFARGDPARTRGGGTGLGLAIVKVIAEAHSGSATIAETGIGRTTVRLRLPLENGTQPVSQ